MVCAKHVLERIQHSTNYTFFGQDTRIRSVFYNFNSKLYFFQIFKNELQSIERVAIGSVKSTSRPESVGVKTNKHSNLNLINSASDKMHVKILNSDPKKHIPISNKRGTNKKFSNLAFSAY